MPKKKERKAERAEQIKDKEEIDDKAVAEIELVKIKEEKPDDLTSVDEKALDDDKYEFQFKITDEDYFNIVQELRAKDDDLIELEQTLLKCSRQGCKKMFETAKRLRKHERNIHERREEEENGVVNNFACTQEGCKRTFKLEKYFKTHLKRHEQDAVDGNFCHLCGLIVEGSLNLHIRNHSKVKRVRPVHKCPICDREFRKSEYFRRHMLVHNDDNLFECEWCHKMFRSEENMKYHKKVKHTGVKDDVCHLCGREFSSHQLLKKHEKTHGTNNPFKCDICFMSYRHQSTLCRHKKIHEHVTQCHVCHQPFQYDSLLRKHLIEFHNDVDAINLPRSQPQKVKRKKKKKVEVDMSSATSSDYYSPQSTVIVNNVTELKSFYPH